jgi:hypothetical protein
MITTSTTEVHPCFFDYSESGRAWYGSHVSRCRLTTKGLRQPSQTSSTFVVLAIPCMNIQSSPHLQPHHTALRQRGAHKQTSIVVRNTSAQPPCSRHTAQRVLARVHTFRTLPATVCHRAAARDPAAGWTNSSAEHIRSQIWCNRTAEARARIHEQVWRDSPCKGHGRGQLLKGDALRGRRRLTSF